MDSGCGSAYIKVKIHIYGELLLYIEHAENKLVSDWIIFLQVITTLNSKNTVSRKTRLKLN